MEQTLLLTWFFFIQEFQIWKKSFMNPVTPEITLKSPLLVGSSSVEASIIGWVLFCWSCHRWLNPLLLKLPSLIESSSVEASIVGWILFCWSLHRWLGPLLLKLPSLIESSSVEAAIVDWILFCWSCHRWLNPLLLKPPSLAEFSSAKNDCYCFFICTLLLKSSNSLKATCNMSISNVLNS